MPRVDTDELVDATEAARILGLASSNAVRVYRGRYPDFPAAVIDRGQCHLWRRSDVVAWAEHRRTA
jgi:hypothetical protein